MLKKADLSGALCLHHKPGFLTKASLWKLNCAVLVCGKRWARLGPLSVEGFGKRCDQQPWTNLTTVTSNQSMFSAARRAEPCSSMFLGSPCLSSKPVSMCTAAWWQVRAVGVRFWLRQCGDAHVEVPADQDLCPWPTQLCWQKLPFRLMTISFELQEKIQPEGLNTRPLTRLLSEFKYPQSTYSVNVWFIAIAASCCLYCLKKKNQSCVIEDVIVQACCCWHYFDGLGGVCFWPGSTAYEILCWQTKEIRTESHLKINNEKLQCLRRVIHLDCILSTWYASVKLFKCSIQTHSIVENNSEKGTVNH